MYQKIDSFLRKLSFPFRKNSCSKEYIHKPYVISMLKSILAKNDYDAVVIQNSGYLLKVFRNTDLLEKYKGKIYYHLHNNIPMNAENEVLKQTKFLLISRFLLKKLKEKCGEDVENRCYIVKNGICCENFRKTLIEKEQLSLRNKLDISPDEFMGWIKNVAYVVTSSFHETVFSINLEKQFFYESSGSRIDNIVKITGTENRSITQCD